MNKPTINSISLGIIGLFFALGVLAQEPDTPQELNSIQSISASNETGGKVIVTVAMRVPFSNQPAAFTINTPPRIAFDFPNTVNGLGKTTQEFGEGDLRSANIVQAGNRTRMVINLNQMLSYETKAEGNNLLITLQKKAAPGVMPIGASHFADAKPSSQKHSLRDVDFRRGKNGEGRVQIDLSDTEIGIDIKQQGRLLLVEFQHTSLPSSLQRKLDVSDFGTKIFL